MLFIAKTSTPDVHTLAFANEPGEGDKEITINKKNTFNPVSST